MVRKLPVIHHLQQDIVQILMRLFDFIQQQYRMRVLINRIRQKPALIKADIARRRTNQARHAMAFHIFGHVEADQFNAKRLRQLLGDFRLAHTRGAGEQIIPDRLFRIAQPSARKLDGAGKGFNGLFLAKHHRLQIAFQILQRFPIIGGNRFRRNARDLGDNVFHILQRHGLAALVFGQQHARCADLINHVNRLIGQLAVMDVFRGKLHRGADRFRRIAHLMVLFVIGLEPLQDLHRIFKRWLIHINLLEAPHQSAVLFKMRAKFLVGGGTDAADRALRQSGLQ